MKDTPEIMAAKAEVARAEKAMKDAYKALPVVVSMDNPKYLDYMRLKGEFGNASIALSRARYKARNHAA